MSDLMEQGPPSARHLLAQFLTLANVPQAERQHYISQADELRSIHGEAWLAAWLQTWIDEAQATAAFIATRMRARVDAAHERLPQGLPPHPPVA